MQFELRFTNEPTAIPVVGAMLREALDQLPLDADTANVLRDLDFYQILHGPFRRLSFPVGQHPVPDRPTGIVHCW